MTHKLATIFLLLAFSSGIHFLKIRQNSDAQTASQSQLSWAKLHFGEQRDGTDYRIKEIVVTIPKNSEQEMLYGLDEETRTDPNRGPLEDPIAELKSITIDDKVSLSRIEASFLEFLRLQSDGGSVYGQIGRIEVMTNSGNFTLGISERGFTLGEGSPTNENTFYSWTLAKLIDEQLKKRFETGIKSKYFDLLSGQLAIDRERSSYEEAMNTGRK